MAQDAPGYPKKYWWLVVVVLPIVLGLITLLPRFLEKKAEPGTPSVKQDGIGNVSQGGSGNVNIANSDLSSKMYVTNVSIIAGEYAKYQGQALNDEELKRQIDRAVSEAVSGKHGESIRLFEELSRKVSLPAIYNNLGVEYAKAGRPDDARKAFNEAIQKDPTNQEARKNLDLLTGRKRDDRPRSTSAAVKTEASTVPAILVEPLDVNPEALKAIHLVESGSKLQGSYKILYQPQPGTPTIVEPGKYDVVVKTAGDGTFVLARDIEAKERTQVRLNPNAIVGDILVEPLTRKGFPDITELIVFEAGTTGYRLIYQRTDKLGVPLPIIPGRYDVHGKTAEGGEFVLATNVDVKARETQRINPNTEVAAIVVHDPKLPGQKVEAVYVLQTGTNKIVSQTSRFDAPMLVAPGESYDVALKQPGGIARIKNRITPKRGELTEVP